MVESENIVRKNGVEYNALPPEGGWGYMVCLSIAIQFTVLFAPVSAFGMVYNDFLVDIGEGTSGVTLVFGIYFISLSITGFASNVLLKQLSLRQVALLGSTIISIANFLGIFVSSITHVVITNGLILGAGSGFLFPVSYASFNTYFTKQKLAYLSAVKVLVGVGCASVPLLLKYCMEEFGFRGTLAIIFALELNSVFASLLLHPVAWHLILVEKAQRSEDDENTPLEKSKDLDLKTDKLMNGLRNEIKHETKPDRESHCLESSNDSVEANQFTSSISQESKGVLSLLKMNDKAPKMKAMGVQNDDKIHANLIDEQDSKGKMDIHDIRLLRRQTIAGSFMSLANMVAAEPIFEAIDKRGRLNFIIDYLDLSLFNDIIYTNITIGMAITVFSDCTFFMLLPLSLYKIGWESGSVAWALALAAIGDTVGKMGLVVVSKCTSIASRHAFLTGMLATVVLRFVYEVLSGKTSRLVVIALMGAVRCLLHGTSPLVFAEHVPASVYPAAFGLYMLVFGLINMLGGPIIGMIRDLTGSYPLVFRILTSLIVLSVLPWLLELFFFKRPVKNIETSNSDKKTSTEIK